MSSIPQRIRVKKDLQAFPLNRLLLELIQEMVLVRELPGKDTMQQLRERLRS